MSANAPLTAADHHTRVKAEFARLLQNGADHREWLRFTTSILEAMMACQAIVMDRQRKLIERARAGDLRSEVAALRTESKDALYVVDQLTELYHRIKNEVLPNTRREP